MLKHLGCLFFTKQNPAKVRRGDWPGVRHLLGSYPENVRKPQPKDTTILDRGYIYIYIIYTHINSCIMCMYI